MPRRRYGSARVFLALCRAEPANQRARFELSADVLHLRLLLTREDATSGNADVAAVLIQSNAASQHVELFLAEARVGARDTGLRAIEARIDTRREPLDGHRDRSRIPLDHFGGMHAPKRRNRRPRCALEFSAPGEIHLRRRARACAHARDRNGHFSSSPSRTANAGRTTALEKYRLSSFHSEWIYAGASWSSKKSMCFSLTNHSFWKWKIALR